MGVLSTNNETRGTSVWNGPESANRVSVFEFDPDLGAGLDTEHFELAARELTAPLRTLDCESWRAAEEMSSPGVGLLVVEGTLAREVRISRQPAYTELLGPGDLYRPWAGAMEGLAFCVARWRALQPADVLVLDERFAARLWRWPSVGSELVGRALRRARWQTMSAALASVVRVDDRLLLAFAQLAERWGRVTPDGVVIRLPLTHELLATLVGARRPSVTTALGRMASDGHILRTGDDDWLLTRAAHEQIGTLCAEPESASA